VQSPTGETLSPLNWEEAFRIHTDYLHTRRFSQRTIYGYGRDLHKLKDALVADASCPSEVTLDCLRRYQLKLLSRRQSAGTVAKVTARVRAFFEFLFLDELIEKNPAARLRPPRIPPRLPGQVLTPREMQLLLEAADESQTPLLDRAALEVLYSTGVRRAELLALDLFDVDHRERTLVVRAGKGEKPRLLPIPPTCYEALSRYLEYGRPELERRPTPALFLGPRGSRLGRSSLSRLLSELQQRAGIQKQVTPHVFRRSCATGLLKNGTSLSVIQAVLGHASLETTSVYLCLTPDEIRQEVLTRHPRERFE
jgi:integrase/recombinase XerD